MCTWIKIRNVIFPLKNVDGFGIADDNRVVMHSQDEDIQVQACDSMREAEDVLFEIWESLKKGKSVEIA